MGRRALAASPAPLFFAFCIAPARRAGDAPAALMMEAVCAQADGGVGWVETVARMVLSHDDDDALACDASQPPRFVGPGGLMRAPANGVRLWWGSRWNRGACACACMAPAFHQVNGRQPRACPTHALRVFGVSVAWQARRARRPYTFLLTSAYVRRDQQVTLNVLLVCILSGIAVCRCAARSHKQSPVARTHARNIAACRMLLHVSVDELAGRLINYQRW